MGNERKRYSNTVEALMRTKVRVLRPTDTIKNLVSFFSNTSYETAPIVDRDGNIQGIVYRTDMLKMFVDKKESRIRFILEEKYLYDTYCAQTAADVMHQRFEKIRISTPLNSALDAMIERRLSSIPVIEGRTLFCGLLTWYDLMRCFSCDSD